MPLMPMIRDIDADYLPIVDRLFLELLEENDCLTNDDLDEMERNLRLSQRRIKHDFFSKRSESIPRRRV